MALELEKFIINTENWRLTEYANGDTVNLVDPSGHVALPAVVLGAGVGGIASGMAAYYWCRKSGALAGTGPGGVFGVWVGIALCASARYVNSRRL